MRHLSWIPVSRARYVVFQPGRHSFNVVEMGAIFKRMSIRVGLVRRDQ